VVELELAWVLILEELELELELEQPELELELEQPELELEQPERSALSAQQHPRHLETQFPFHSLQ